ncbi:MAG: RNA polymerase sigma factor [bacterium ADurb.Bin236]|nr:MAG: RNA polymerase sigma factor [bacterium ADurb.Bin236]HOY63862.1 sigma-70 family RNA polymerase sigma factor [bacterium]
MFSANKYEDFTDYEVELARATARKMVGNCGLSMDDVPDLEQELMCHLWKKKREFNPEHLSQCSYKTFVSRVIAKKKVSIFREKSRERRLLDHRKDLIEAYGEELFDDASDASDASPCITRDQITWSSANDSSCGSVEERVISKVLLEENLKKLPFIQQTVFLLREAGYSPLDISEQLNISKTAVYKHLNIAILKLNEAGVFDRRD